MSEFESIHNSPEEPQDEIQMRLNALSELHAPVARPDREAENLKNLTSLSVAQFRRLDQTERLRLLTGSDKIEPGKALKIDFGGNKVLEQTITLGELLPPDIRNIRVTDAKGNERKGARRTAGQSEFLSGREQLIILSGYRFTTAISGNDQKSEESNNNGSLDPRDARSFETAPPDTASEAELQYIEQICKNPKLKDWQKANIRYYGPTLFRECEENGLSAFSRFIFAQVENESSWNPLAGNLDSNEDSTGLLQVNLKVYKDKKVYHPDPHCPFTVTAEEIRTIPRINLKYACWYLGKCVREAGGSIVRGLNNYNGKGNLKKPKEKRYASRIARVQKKRY